MNKDSVKNIQSHNVEGVLPILKPAGYTSHDVVAVLRRMLGIKRIGHTGTLDPLVTGALPVCIGRATRLVEYIQDLPKTYEAVLKLGVATDTEDISGRVVAETEHVEVSRDQVERAIIRFIGPISQIPPMYSAVKVQGKRLYELARSGQEVERPARTVHIHNIDVIHMKLDQSHPEIKFRVTCSKGTYIRTLCYDIGQALGFPATMSHLVRTASGNIRSGQCITLDQVALLHQSQQLHRHIIPMDEAVRHLPAMYINGDAVDRALQGQKLSLSHLISDIHDSDGQQDKFKIRLYAPNHYFLGIYEMNFNDDLLKPLKVFGERGRQH